MGMKLECEVDVEGAVDMVGCGKEGDTYCDMFSPRGSNRPTVLNVRARHGDYSHWRVASYQIISPNQNG